MSDKWVVWRRNDGYVHASRYLPSDYVGGGPYRDAKEIEVGVKDTEPRVKTTFQKIAEVEGWDTAAEIIRTERSKVTA